jgi:hypothetical protein
LIHSPHFPRWHRRPVVVTLTGWLAISLISGCGVGPSQVGVKPTASVAPPSAETAVIPSPSPTVEPPGGPSAVRRQLAGGLTLEAYPLAGPPTSEPLAFQPLVGSQSDVLAKHAAERAETVAQQVSADDQFRPTLTAASDKGGLLARIDTDPATQEQTVSLFQGGQLIFTAPAGFPSPGPALQGLWAYNDHWALELLMATPDLWVGQVYVDGALLNDQLGVDEVFGFQLLAGRPFFFFAKGGRIGVSYDGQLTDLGYTNVPHYECCSGSVLNPVQAQSMVAFFAEDTSGWRYVEIGAFSDP